MTAASRLPVTDVGGYLRAGKTTLVNSLLRQGNGWRRPSWSTNSAHSPST